MIDLPDKVTRMVRIGVPMLLLVIIIEIIWFSCITLFDGGNDGTGDAAIRSQTGLPSPSQPNSGNSCPCKD